MAILLSLYTAYYFTSCKNRNNFLYKTLLREVLYKIIDNIHSFLDEQAKEKKNKGWE